MINLIWIIPLVFLFLFVFCILRSSGKRDEAWEKIKKDGKIIMVHPEKEEKWKKR